MQRHTKLETIAVFPTSFENTTYSITPVFLYSNTSASVGSNQIVIVRNIDKTKCGLKCNDTDHTEWYMAIGS